MYNEVVTHILGFFHTQVNMDSTKIILTNNLKYEKPIYKH
jgi:hypothetical protein